MTQQFDTLEYDVADGIATIRLNRPDRLNAFNQQMGWDLIAAFDATDADDAVRVVVVTGNGRGFCAGADLEKGRHVRRWPGEPALGQRDHRRCAA